MKCKNCEHYNICVVCNYMHDKCGYYEPTKPHGEWIHCSESLPEECENVLGWIERDAWVDGNDYPIRKQEAAIGWHIKGRWHFDGYSGTTECLAWMPLPEPYKKEGGANEK